MKGNRFIVSIDSSTDEQDTTFIQYLNRKNLTWHHWIKGAWLVIDPSNIITTEEIASNVSAIYPRIRFLVNKVELKGWYGFGPNDPTDPKKNMFKWIDDFWLDK